MFEIQCRLHPQGIDKPHRKTFNSNLLQLNLKASLAPEIHLLMMISVFESRIPEIS